jgi:FKBP-type peptidyl-prolyl cis-trans isomerase
LKAIYLLAFTAAATLAAHAQDTKPEPKAGDSKAGCTPAPTQLVKKDLEPGTGRDVMSGSAVLVGYTGWLYDGCAKDLKGKKFDSSEGRTTPFGFMVGAGRVIKGWDEGLVGMKEKGAKRLLVIPPDKGYGEKGAGGGVIPPNATLVFEVEMFQIVHQPEGAAKAAPTPAPKEPAKEKK